MARWITQTYSIDEHSQIEIGEECVIVSSPNGQDFALFRPKDLQDAMGMSIALRAAAKRLEDIGKNLVK